MLLLLGPAPPAEGPPPELEWEELDDPEAPPAPEDPAPPDEPDAPNGAPVDDQDPSEEPAEQDLQPAAPSTTVATPIARQGGKPRLRTYPKTWLNVGFGVGASWFAIGVGVHHFFIPHLGIGLEIRDEVYISRPTFNEFNVTPIVSFLVLPRRRFTPLLRAGFGGEFVSHGGGSYGRWLAGAAFVVRLTRRWTIAVGLDVTGNVPDARFADRFKCAFTRAPCSLSIEPNLGLSVALGK